MAIKLAWSGYPIQPCVLQFCDTHRRVYNALYWENRLLEDIVESLKTAGITIEPYESFYSSLTTVSTKLSESNKKFYIPDNANWEVVRNLKCEFSQGLSPVEELKAIKNNVELEGAKIAHLKDGRALIKFLLGWKSK